MSIVPVQLGLSHIRLDIIARRARSNSERSWKLGSWELRDLRGVMKPGSTWQKNGEKPWFFITKMDENINFDKTDPQNDGWKMQKFWNDNVRKIRIDSAGVEGIPFSTTTKVWNNHKSSPRSTSFSAAICLMRFWRSICRTSSNILTLRKRSWSWWKSHPEFTCLWWAVLQKAQKTNQKIAASAAPCSAQEIDFSKIRSK